MDKYEILKELVSIENPNIQLILKRIGSKVTYEGFLYTLSLTKYNLAKELGISASTTSKLLKEVFPNRVSIAEKVDVWLLQKYGLKQCKKCEEVFWIDEGFNKNKNHKDGVNTYCKTCHSNTNAETQNSRQSVYRAKKLQRTPKWSDLNKIKEFYKNCPNGYHVDHFYPLQGLTVSGLHVIENLQYLTEEDNLRKHNKFPE